ncbi:unnamed protein product [Ascophyllum nodosum]
MTMRDFPTGHWGTHSISCYEKVEQIGEGTYGQVYKARNRVTKGVVALKKIRVHSENFGLPLTAIREMKILTELSHPSMVRLLEIVTSVGEEDDEDDEKDTPRTDRKRRGSLYIVLEYLEHDLAGLLDLNIAFSQIQIKALLLQLFEVLSYVHENKYVHRDIKCSNLLIDNHLRMKLADFGLARRLSDTPADITNRVITLWYRPPELLLGATRYGPCVDCWGVGCIFAELIIGKPLFPAKVEQEQLELIFKVCGTPDSKRWPGYDDLPSFSSIMPKMTYPERLKQHLTEAARIAGTEKLVTSETIDLISRLLTLDPHRRTSAQKALETRYFRTHPICPANIFEVPPLELPERDGSYHEFQTKRKRREEGLIQQDAKRAQRKKDKRGAVGDPRRGGDRPSPRSPNNSSVSASISTDVMQRGPAVGPSGSAVAGSVAPQSSLSSSGNWAPPLPPPSLLAPPPPPASRAKESSPAGLPPPPCVGRRYKGEDSLGLAGANAGQQGQLPKPPPPNLP